ncbi:MAG: response regulator [Deltaproteobacteria bacterium]|nr:response regulator [Deltaproteobacteria bacterium]
MHRVVWIGPRFSARELRLVLGEQTVEVEEFDHVNAAIEVNAGRAVAVAVVLADWADAPAAITAWREARPEVEVLAATRRGVPVHVAMVLKAGASDVLDLAARSAQDVVAQLNAALGRYERSRDEHALLVRLRALNEEFLRNFVALEKRNIELQQSLEPQSILAIEGRPRILVIDDEPALLQVFEMILEGGDYDVVTALDAMAAMNAFRAQPFHLVITDKNLPGKSGMEVMREVREVNPMTDVIMITGYGSKEAAVEALNLGACAFLEKPFDDVNAVRAKVDAVLTRQRERAVRRQYLQVIKERNRAFLERYREIRKDLETVLQRRDQPAAPAAPVRGSGSS